MEEKQLSSLSLESLTRLNWLRMCPVGCPSALETFFRPQLTKQAPMPDSVPCTHTIPQISNKQLLPKA